MIKCIGHIWFNSRIIMFPNNCRFADDIEYMTGKRPYLFWMICWKYISPLAIFIIFMANVVNNLSSGVAQYSVFVGCKEQYVS